MKKSLLRSFLAGFALLAVLSLVPATTAFADTGTLEVSVFVRNDDNLWFGADEISSIDVDGNNHAVEPSGDYDGTASIPMEADVSHAVSVNYVQELYYIDYDTCTGSASVGANQSTPCGVNLDDRWDW